jgi:CheY-like chemotaxis protein/two-component sensor histidine kinase
MSHEMRTPLNVVVGLTDLRMEDVKLPLEVKEDMKKINAAGELLLGIVNDVLDISKIESGMLEIMPANYDTASLLNDIITLNMIRIESKPIKFKLDISENLPSELCGDELRVKQIFNNLLSNAFKYTEEGTVTFHMDFTPEKLSPGPDENSLSGGNGILISATVSDTGIGIRQEDIKNLFSEYNQVDTKANRKIEGTGLGLSITKKLVELMGGEITVESIYGVGTSFHVSLRQSAVGDLTLGSEIVRNLSSFRYVDDKQHVSSKLVRPDLSGARVLVVDDFPTNLDVAAGMLRKYKINVDCASSGQDAINLIKAGKPLYNAIFMDHMMPGMDGVEATQVIRSLDSEYARTVPIISLTANALVGSEQMFLDKGFDAFLSKPINIFKLDSIVKRWVRNKPRSGQETGKPIEEASETFKNGLKPGEQAESETLEYVIPGVDMIAGLEFYRGEMDVYISTLESFAANLLAAIEKIRTVAERNLAHYAITMLGIKSISRNIGAVEICEKAAKLEAMAKTGDLPGVLAENADFCMEAEILVQNVNNWLKTSAIISE